MSKHTTTTTTTTTRRTALLAGVSAVAALPTAATAIGGLAPQPADPIFAALEETRKLLADWTRQDEELDDARGAAIDVHGFAAYREASEEEWDKVAGITSMRAQYKRTVAAGRASRMQFAMTKPTTVAGVAAMVDYAIATLDGEDWEMAALATVAEALRGLDGGVQS